jgi:hypothetical protein
MMLQILKRICIIFKADPDPDFYVGTDPDPDMDPDPAFNDDEVLIFTLY